MVNFMRLKELRLEFNLSLRDFEKFGIGKNVINSIENGDRKLTEERLVFFCELFKVTSDYLLGLTDDGILVKVFDKLYSINKVQFNFYSSINMISYVDSVRILNVSSLEDIEFVNSNVPSIKLKKESI